MRTTIRTIAFYDRFACLGENCPQTCCYGWKIPVDEEAAARYRRESGMLGLRVRLALHRGENPYFNKLTIRCPLLDPDGLCALQKKRGEKHLPEVCRVYPREWANLGSFVERTLDLSCVRAAEVFLEAADDPESGLGWTEETGLWELPRAGDNDDPAFLEELEKSRKAALERILDPAVATADALDDLIFALADEAKLAQNKTLRTEEGGMHRIRLFPFSIMLFNEIMSTCFYEEHLMATMPKLNRMCRGYYKYFDRLTEIEGQAKLQEMLSAYLERSDLDIRRFVRYFAYCLERTWFDSYEDYSFLRRIIEAAVHTNMMLLFELLALHQGDRLDIRERAKMIAAYEKRAWHNNDVLGDMVKQVNGRFV